MNKIALLIIGTFIYGCNSAKQPVITKPTPAQITEFTNNSTLIIPATAKAIGWYEERGMDDALYLQIEMQTSELEQFLDNTPFKNAVFSKNSEYDLYTFNVFYKSNPPTTYRSAEVWLPNARAIKILVNESNPANTIVYLLWHET